MRLFIAIPLASEAVDALERLVHTLRSAGDSLRWTSPETWHITLQFLGETSLETYACLAQQLCAIQSPPVPVWLHGTGLFDRAGVFFAGVNVSPELRRLEQLVLAATASCGIAAEKNTENHSWHPHVTLARAQRAGKPHALRKLKSHANSDIQFPAFTAKEFLLFESFLGPAGARHEIRDRFPLA
jgi:RNA 2',3'-cyclic 3'-phosphodiesterase